MTSWGWLLPIVMFVLALWGWEPVGRVPPGLAEWEALSSEERQRLGEMEDD